jgi:predicted protein tyrosine phosphatase
MREQDPNCELIRASFAVYGDTLDPDRITNETGIVPSYAYKKGQSRRKRLPTAKTGSWALQSPPSLKSTNLEDHLEHLLLRLKGQAPYFASLAQVHHARFFIGWFAAPSLGGGPSISPPILRMISALGATINFDFYGPEWSGSKSLLFVHGQNSAWARTAEVVFSQHEEIEAIAASVEEDAPRPLDVNLIQWASMIFVDEKALRNIIVDRFEASLGDRRIQVIGIPDSLEFMSPRLIHILERRVSLFAQIECFERNGA